jgi:methyl acetate hydrolase
MTSISPIKSTRLQAVDSVLKEAVDAGLVPGAVAAVSSPTACLYLSAFGRAVTEPYQAMQTDTVFRIASMTKLVTSVGVMMLVDEGLLSLDATLGEYVPGFRQPPVLVDFDTQSGSYTTRPALRDATLRELLSHTGGYGYWWLHEPLRLASGEKPDLARPPFLVADPGTAFAYSTSTDVIGLLFEPLTGQPLDAYLRDRIFEPLGMVDTGYRRPANRSRLAQVHRRAGAGFRQLPDDAPDNDVSGGTGLFSTAADYSRLLRCLLAGGEADGRRLLSAAAVQAIASNQVGELEAGMQRTAFADRSNDLIFMDGSQKYGFGVMVEMVQQPGKRSVGSYGWGGICNTYFWVDPTRNLAAVLMLQMLPFANRQCVDLLDRFERAVYEAMEG